MTFARSFIVVAVAALLLGCSGSSLPRAASAWPANALDCEKVAISVDDAVAELLKLVNGHRRSLGLSKLVVDSRISKLAQSHSNGIARSDGNLSHAGAEERYMKIASFLPAKKFAENISQSCGDSGNAAAGAFALWLKSRSHKENMEGPYTDTGIGVAQGASGRSYFTQLFAGP